MIDVSVRSGGLKNNPPYSNQVFRFMRGSLCSLTNPMAWTGEPVSEASGFRLNGSVWARVNCEQPLVRGHRGLDQLGISPVGHVDKANVVVLAVHATEDRFVAPGEPVRAEGVGSGHGLLDIVAVTEAALGLILRLHEPDPRPSPAREVNSPINDRPAAQAKDQTERGLGYRYYVEQAVSLPYSLGAHWFAWRDEPVLGRMDGENLQHWLCRRDRPGLSRAGRGRDGHAQAAARNSLCQTLPLSRKPLASDTGLAVHAMGFVSEQSEPRMKRKTWSR